MAEQFNINPDLVRGDKQEPLSEDSLKAMERAKKEAGKLSRKELLERAGVVGMIGGFAAALGYMGHKASQAERAKKPKLFLLDTLQKSENPDKKRFKELQEKLGILEQVYGQDVYLWFIRAEEFKKKFGNDIPVQPQISGFEKIDLSNEDIQKLFAEGMFPKGALSRNVRAVTYTHEYMHPNTGLEGIEISAGGEVFPDGTIKIYRSYKDENDIRNQNRKNDLGEIIPHEVAHKQSWDLSFNYELSQRIDFLYELHTAHKTSLLSDNDVLKAEKDFHSKKDTTLASKKLAYLGEWWAEICTEAYNSPDHFFNSATNREQDLVMKWFVGGDNNFNFFNAKQARDKIYKNIQKSKAK